MRDELTILVAEDSPQDAELLGLALRKAGMDGHVKFVGDGQEATDYLEGRGRYADRTKFPFPKVIISDLKMPRLNGLELLHWLRSHPSCSVIPAILISGSNLSADIAKAYRLGANTFFQKPTNFNEMVHLFRTLKEYWSRSELPPVQHAAV